MTDREYKFLRRIVKWKQGWFRKASLLDQLSAIEGLATSGRQDALDFLERLYKPDIKVEERVVLFINGMDVWKELRDDECHSYPNAAGPLSDALYFHVNVTTQGIRKGAPRPQEDIERERAVSAKVLYIAWSGPLLSNCGRS